MMPDGQRAVSPAWQREVLVSDNAIANARASTDLGDSRDLAIRGREATLPVHSLDLAGIERLIATIPQA
jgi:hypothetical protein